MRLTNLRRRGIALPMVLFLIVVLSTMAAGAMVLVGSEARVAGSADTQLEAYAIARSGLDRYFALRADSTLARLAPGAYDSTRVIVANGWADVVSRQLRGTRGGTVPALYVITSRGVRTARGSLTRPVAERTVAEYARWQDASMQTLGAWTSLRGIVKAGAVGTLSGLDACGAAAPIAGVAVTSAPGYVQGSGSSIPSGSPNVLDLGIPPVAANAVALDWSFVLDPGPSYADVRIPGDPWPSASQFASPDYWPFIFAADNYTLPSDGRGLLVVSGHLTMSGSQRWEGVVLVGESLRLAGSSQIDGTVITGLNLKLGIPSTAPDDASGNITVRYNSCAIARALARYQGLSRLQNASVDNWPTY